MAKILVVEDDEQLRQNICEQLELDNYEVKVAGNGLMALDLLPSFYPDLILCDVLMPEMNGIDFIRAVKDDRKFRNVPFIFLTAKVAQEDKLLGLEEGAIDYLSKPFLRRELLLKVNNIITQRSDFILNQLMDPATEGADFQFVRQLTASLEAHFDDSSLTANKVAELMNMSLSAFQRHIKAYFPRNFNEILREHRLKKAMLYLTQTDQSLQWIADRCGFSSLSYFSYCFKKAYQIAPLRFRTNNRPDITIS
ncbi:response regulator transcription factor [Spirosoma aerophilum]